MTLEEKLDVLENLDSLKADVARELYEPLGNEMWKVAANWHMDEFIERARDTIARRKEAGL